LDSFVLKALVNEIKSWCPGIIGKVVQPDWDTIWLKIKGKGNPWMALCTRYPLTGLYIRSETPPRVVFETPFSLTLAKNIVGGELTQITVNDFDRVVKVEIIPRKAGYRLQKHILIAELIGHRAGLFFVDDDNVIHQDSLMTLLELDKDIVGCVYKKRDGYGTTALKRWDDNYLQDNDCRKIFPTDAIGMGCTLIKREVLVAVRAHHNHPFEYLTQPRKLGEDVTFCERAKKLGHEVWAYNGLETGHIGFRNIIY